MHTPRQLAATIICGTLLKLWRLWDTNRRLRDELDAATTALDGINALVTVSRTPRRPPESPAAAGR